MTIIVGVLDGKGGCFMGGDSAGVGDDQLQIRKDPKVFKVDSYLMGVCASWRVMQLLRFSKPPKPPVKADPFKFMVTKFVPFLRKLLKHETYENSKTAHFLISFRGRLFHIYEDFQVSEEVLPYECCGSGATTARGALYATTLSGHKDQVMLALEAAERFNSGVRSPFVIVHQKS